jgi:cyclopropane fatty-acyl-phospholipid synthase-like methyltransferase
MDNQLAREEVVWPENVRKLCEASAKAFGVSPEVHVEDFIFRFLYENPVFKSKAGAVDYYFRDGNNSATKISKAIDEWLASVESQLSILEFASGYGAVTRHARKLLQPHELHSCDIHAQAVKLISQEFGIKTVQSCEIPEQLELPKQYDMIFVLSFFSHMPEQTWARWLQRLYAGLNGGGVLLFTTHGKVSMKYFPQAKLNSSGYWFEKSSEQKDLDAESYGQTITTKEFVDARIAELPDVRVRDYQEAGWWEHQDLYVLRKE